MVQRDGDGGGAKCNLRGMGGHITQVNPGVEDLADIAEARVAKRHVAKPERAEAQRLGLFSQCDLVEHARSVPVERLHGKE